MQEDCITVKLRLPHLVVLGVEETPRWIEVAASPGRMGRAMSASLAPLPPGRPAMAALPSETRNRRIRVSKRRHLSRTYR